jgi:UDP-N-acetyl-2-amino-2-deoxyglucuronate dehydrogenase
MSEKVGAAMIGCGGIGRCHAAGLQRSPNVRFVAVVDMFEDRVRSFQQRFGAESYYTDAAEMLERDDIQMVVVATAPNAHAPLAIQALEAGKHVMVQKPMALTLEECDRMIAVARANGRKLMNCYVRYFHPAYYTAKQLIEQGAIGDVYLMNATLAWYGNTDNWRFDPVIGGGGILMDGHVHMLSMIKYFTGAEPESVFTDGGTLASQTAVEDTAVMTLRSPGALTCIVGSNRLIEPCDQTGKFYKEEIELHGSKGTIHVRPLKRPSLVVYSTENRSPGGVNGWLTPQLEVVPPEERTGFGHYNGDEDPWTGLHKYFADCILKDVEPITNGEEGRRFLQLVQAGYQSMNTRTVVDVSLQRQLAGI